ncbi:Lrp/AsnC family transcriptional regulator [Candidatus Micrarchaeota archaeon]|nr:Lrp/AsnC family transcriptional regulator [Candidatus Micrarchaeota archaeon]
MEKSRERVNILSDLDERILSQLRQNGRQSFRQLAQKLGVSPASVMQHVRDMETRGAILGYGVDLNYLALGYDLMGLIHVTIRKGALLGVQREIAKIPEVVSVYDVTGDADSLVIVRVKHRSELSRIVKRILKMEHVERSNTSIVLNTIKENYRLQPLEDIVQ